MVRSIFLFVLMLGGIAPATAGDFALRDGDTIVFLGDSITAARTYGKIVEDYTLLRFPERKIRFFNAGLGGDTAAGSLARLDRDVFVHRPTAVVVAFGTNDIGWGVYADEAHKQKYLDAVREIIARCREHGARFYLCSAAATALDPDKAEEGFLQKMCDDGMALARKLGEHSIDVQRAMRSVQRKTIAYSEKSKEKVTLFLADGTHLNDLGQLAMAWAILKGLDAPAEVSSVHVDAVAAKVIEAAGCQVSDLKAVDGGIEFTRQDDGLPFNGGLFYVLNFRFVPVPDELNRYKLQVDGLAKGRYDVTAENLKIGSYTASQLATGINIASATGDAWKPGGPWAVQAVAVHELTEARHALAKSTFLARLYGNIGGSADELDREAADADNRLIAMQRTAARPRPYRFTIRPVVEDKP